MNNVKVINENCICINGTSYEIIPMIGCHSDGFLKENPDTIYLFDCYTLEYLGTFESIGELRGTYPSAEIVCIDKCDAGYVCYC